MIKTEAAANVGCFFFLDWPVVVLVRHQVLTIQSDRAVSTAKGAGLVGAEFLFVDRFMFECSLKLSESVLKVKKK